MIDLMLGLVPDERLDLLSGDLAAPDLIYVEVANVLRNLRARGQLGAADAALLMEGALDLPLDVRPCRELVGRALELGDRLSMYDACYVALAELEGTALVTSDRKLARAGDLPARVVVL